MKDEIKSHWHKWVFYITVGALLIIVYKAIDSIGPLVNGLKTFISVLSPFLVGLLIAYLLYIPESKIERIFKKSSKRAIRKNSRKFYV